MPFVKKSFFVSEPTALFLFVMKTLGISQGEAQRLIHKGRAQKDKNILLNSGEKIEGDISLYVFEPLESNDKIFTPIYKNKDFMIFDKPSGILIHPNTHEAGYSMLDVVRWHGGKTANIAHRLDKETSGLLIAALHKNAEIELKKAFENKAVQKEYLAWVDGELKENLSVTTRLKKSIDFSSNKHKVLVTQERGKVSTTDFFSLFYNKKLDATLVRCVPKTGRMHQIRVHLFHVKHRILGDPIYGVNFSAANRYLDDVLSEEERAYHTGAKRLMLHASRLDFRFQNDYFTFESEIDFTKMQSLITPLSQREKSIY
ncbi:MAG: RluA family pseudouridine synthase [Campylobacterales bacterium]|nr:RluA family pseudouridine synthase [Campylobacterales bacterium]